MPIINQDISAGSVTTPSAGNTTFFTDSGAAYLKLPSGAVNPVGAGTVSSVNLTSSTLTASGGPVTSSGSLNIELPNTTVTPGSYTSTNLTVDAHGRITSASNGSSAPTPAGLGLGEPQFNISGSITADENFLWVPSSYYGTGILALGYGGSVGMPGASVTSNKLVVIAPDVANTYFNSISVFADQPSSSMGLAINGTATSVGTPVLTFNHITAAATFTNTVTGQLITNIPAPATSTSTGTAGMIAYDASYVYICTATDTWTRAALSTF